MHRVRFLRVLGFAALAAALGACSSGASASPPSTEAFAPITTLPSRNDHEHIFRHHNTPPFDDGPGADHHNDDHPAT